MNIGDAIKKVENADAHLDLYKALIGYLNEALPSDIGRATPGHMLAGFSQEVIEDAIDVANSQLEIWTERKSSFVETKIDGND